MAIRPWSHRQEYALENKSIYNKLIIINIFDNVSLILMLHNRFYFLTINVEFQRFIVTNYHTFRFDPVN